MKTIFPVGQYDSDLRVQICGSRQYDMAYISTLAQIKLGRDECIGDCLILHRDAATGEVYSVLSRLGGKVANHSSLAMAKAYVREQRRRAA